MGKKIVLAYSGGLDTSIIIPWLKENTEYTEVIAMAADVGQGEELEPLREKAAKTGAAKLYIEDLREEFITGYIYPTLKAGAVYERKYLLGTSMARPVIAKRLVEIARQEGAAAVAHGCTGKGNDQVRFELTVKALAPDLKVVAPWRVWDIKSREQEVDYARARGIDVPVSRERPYSMDRNIWHLSHEGADLEEPGNEPKDDVLLISKRLEDAPDSPAYLELEFERGIPVALDGKKLPPVDLLSKLNEIGAAHGVGVADILENRLVGMKSRGVYENPGGAILYYAHNELEYLTLDRTTLHYKDLIAQRYAELVYDGVWFHPLREALDAFTDKIQEVVTGKARLKLYKGNICSAGAWSPYSLFNAAYSTFGEDDVYNQADAEGFINLFGLPLKMRALMQKRNGSL
ncbi:MAG: argininosuccinate synthase [Peptococcaceae bacterium]|jgi:argininosuccinate synthase|nr:argininosuccinate synthase [Peptococcaceae bacterium]